MRGTVIYLAVFALMRAVGRRESGELNMSDIILVVIISKAATIGLGGKLESVADSLIVVVTIVAWSLVLAFGRYRWAWARKILAPKPRLLIRDGVINVGTARHEWLTREDIRSQLRVQGIDDIARVKQAYVEPDGSISVIKESKRSGA